MEKIDVILAVLLFLVAGFTLGFNIFLILTPKKSEIRVLPAQVNQLPIGQGIKAIEGLNIQVEEI